VPAFGAPEPLALPPPSPPLPPPASRPQPDRDGDGIPDELDACPDHAGPPSADPRRNGCPALAAVVGRRIQILQRIQFETDRDVLRPESEPVLRDVAAVLLAHPEITRVWVEGHTDGAGEAARNALLSEQRARAVLRWLVRRGVALDRLQARGLGPTRPIGSNRTPEGRAANRRVEFRVE
jgi:outer membrane protein OmpA-like peptidoglycan-associated protein